MTLTRNKVDSIQLDTLRLHFARFNPGLRATPTRLGYHSAMHDRPITDYGAHSKRWIRFFEIGHEIGFNSRQISTQKKGQISTQSDIAKP